MDNIKVFKCPKCKAETIKVRETGVKGIAKGICPNCERLITVWQDDAITYKKRGLSISDNGRKMKEEEMLLDDVQND
jgi:transposase-like protein